MLLAADLRRELPGIRVLTHCGGGKYNSQLKKAYASGARWAVILEGSEELAEIKLKTLDEDGDVATLSPAGLCEHLKTCLSSNRVDP
jgi:histidyl-tRNA synthetase